MIATKLISLLKILNKKEIAEFIVFLKSDLYYVRTHVVELSALLQHIHPDFSDDNINAEKISKLLFGKNKTDKAQLRHVFSHTTQLLEVFIAFRGFQKKGRLQEELLLREMLNRKQPKYFMQLYNSFENDIEKGSQRNSEHHQLVYIKDELCYEYFTSHDDHDLNNLQQVSNSLDVMYLSKKLKYLCEMLNQQNIMQVKYNLSFWEELKTVIPKSEYLKIPAIGVYFSILQMLQFPDKEKNYFLFKKQLFLHEAVFPHNEQRNLFTYLQNYCIQMVNNGVDFFLEEMFNNYEHMLKNKIITAENKISQFDFKNIITLAIRLTKFDWSEDFMRKYSFMLDANHKENAINYNQSRIYYSKKEYKFALKILQQVEFTDAYYQLDSKILLLKIYFDTGEEEPFYSLINSFKIFLKRNKQISRYQYTVNYNFCMYILRLYKIKSGGTGSKSKIKESLLNNRNVIDINWLEDRLLKLG